MKQDPHVLTGAYAAGGLSTLEREAFEEHLAACDHCDQEVRELAEASALLGVAATAPPPAGLRHKVMEEVARTRQEPPLLSQQRAAVSRASRRLQGRARRWSLTAAACLAVFSIGLGGYAAQLHNDLSDLRAKNVQVTALRTADDARNVSSTTGGVTGTVTISEHNDGMVFASRGLSPAGDGRTYQLWLIGSDGARSAGTFTPEDGAYGPQLLGGPGKARRLAVTVEPAGGSVRPTTDPVVSLDLTT